MESDPQTRVVTRKITSIKRIFLHRSRCFCSEPGRENFISRRLTNRAAPIRRDRNRAPQLLFRKNLFTSQAAASAAAIRNDGRAAPLFRPAPIWAESRQAGPILIDPELSLPARSGSMTTMSSEMENTLAAGVGRIPGFCHRLRKIPKRPPGHYGCCHFPFRSCPAGKTVAQSTHVPIDTARWNRGSNTHQRIRCR